MPYIKTEDRVKFENLVKDMSLTKIDTAGELNYLITRLVLSFLSQKNTSYQNYNDAIGALEGAKLELYRRSVSKYEDKKIKENGDVY
jgi:hypothetical protein